MELEVQAPARSFRDLRVWQSAYELAIMVYKVCEGLPTHERYGLASQMSRAAVSVCSNIAEGFGRRTVKEKDQFYGVANGSLTELENQLLIAKGVGYVQNEDLLSLMNQAEKTHRMLVALQKANKQHRPKLHSKIHNLTSII